VLTVEDVPPLRTRRKIRGMSAVLLPFDEAGQIDWDAFAAHVLRTADAGLTPAVNMDTGYATLIDRETRFDVLRHARAALGGREFVAGAVVSDHPGDSFQLRAYLQEIEEIDELGGTPVILPSYGLAHQEAERIVNDYEALASCCERFLALEVGEQIAPCGRIYGMEVYEALFDIPQCIGAVHASRRRTLEWQRVRLRDQVRADFMIVTGNELAIDMVMYGSDYLLGLGTFAPDWFAVRDRLWREGDARFYELNDLLQSLGSFAFRDPGQAHRHSAAQFLHLRGWIKTAGTHPSSPQRPSSDIDILRDSLITIEAFVGEIEERVSG
jgi:dihydrodipicolinate synthase/N-acetylneuraminate lyase